MSDFYSAIVFLSAFIMIIMVLLVRSNDLVEYSEKQTIYTISVLVIAGAVSEWLAVWMDGADPSLRLLHVILKTIELSTAPVIPVLCSSLIRPIRCKKVIFGLLAIHVLLEILFAFWGLDYIFWVDEQSTRHYGTHRTLVAILPLFFFCGFLIEYQTVTVRITWLCASVAILMVYILYSELRQKTDALTHLLNRSSYESRLAALREHAVIYYFDVDEFKSINDTYGHGEGDSMLSEVGSVIYASFSHVGHCYRIGGDEFCVIARISDMAAEAQLSEFLRELAAQREQCERLPHVSVGYACYHPERDSIEDVIARADQMMYHYKRKLKDTVQLAGDASE